MITGTVSRLEILMRQYSLPYGTEAQLQLAVAELLIRDGIAFERERSLGGDFGRIDFFADGVGIECKVSGPPSAVLRQLVRYADHPDIKALLLITSRHTHRFQADEINGKPLVVLWIGGRSL